MILKKLPVIAIIGMLLCISACHSIPDHAKYIPSNALMVAEVNTKELSKKIAWSMLSSSNLWDKIWKGKNKIDSAKQSAFIKNMQEAGVDELNTFYVYLINNPKNEEEACFVALIPLKDAHKWEAFVQKNFDNISIKEQNKRKESLLAEQIYAGWNNNLLVLISIQNTKDYYQGSASSTLSQNLSEPHFAEQLNNAFQVSDENSLLKDKRFTAFEKQAHDFGFWINFDAVMNSYGARNLSSYAGMGLSVSNSMWRNSAFSAATNFLKGRVATDITFYSSDAFKEINLENQPTNVDDDLVQRVPNKHLDFIAAYKMSPMATQKTIEKLGMLGLANNFLKEADLSIEEILSAFTGNMLFAVNNFNQTKEILYFDSTDKSSAFANYKTDLDLMFAIQLNNTQAFQKIINLGVEANMLEHSSENTYQLKSNTSSKDSSIIMIKDKIAVFANKTSLAQAYLEGKNTAQTPLIIKENIMKHPMGIYFDFQNWAQRNKDAFVANKADSITLYASLNTFKDFTFNGGTLKDNAYHYKLNINFMNDKESSLISLIEYSKLLQEAQSIRALEDQEFEAMMQQNTDSLEYGY